jgi:hypothetical protein
MIDWSRREHRRQLETIQQVLTMLQERIDASSRAFHYVVRLHDAMQEIIRLHTGIHNRPWLAGSWRLAIRAPPGGVRAFCNRTRRSDRRDAHDVVRLAPPGALSPWFAEEDAAAARLVRHTRKIAYSRVH